MDMRKVLQRGWVAVLIISSITSAGLKYVDAVDLDLGECYFFDNAAQQFQLFTTAGSSEVTVDVGSLHIAGGGWDYSFAGKIIITPSDLYYKNSSGQRASAYFTNSDATLTIVASTLTDKQTAEEIVNPTTNPEGVVLLTAVMNDELSVDVLEDRAVGGGVGEGGRIVGQVRLVGGADLHQPGPALAQHVGNAETAADLQQLAAADQHLAPGAQPGQRQVDGRRIVVDNQGIFCAS
mgnify:CR=1 FL=1